MKIPLSRYASAEKIRRSLTPDEIERNRTRAEHYVVNATRFAAATSSKCELEEMRPGF